MQLFSADATILKKKGFKKFKKNLEFLLPHNIEKLPSKVAHNPTSPANVCN